MDSEAPGARSHRETSGASRYGTMRLLALRDRPREKFERLGPLGLGDNELLAVILGHGFRCVSAIEVANYVLEAAGGTHRLTRRSQADLRRLKESAPPRLRRYWPRSSWVVGCSSASLSVGSSWGIHAMWRRICCRATVRVLSSSRYRTGWTPSTGC